MDYVNIGLVVRPALAVGFLPIFILVKQFYNILILLVLTFFSTQNLVAKDVFVLTENSCSSVKDINNAGGKLIDDLVGSVDDVYKAALRADLEASTELAEAIGKNSELLDSWKVVSNGKKSLRSIDNINAIDAFKKANPNITDEALQAAFDGLKASRRQAFINALESCTDNKNLINSLKKSRLASVEEIRDALNKMRNYKTGKPQVGNLGYVDGDIPNITIDQNKFWESVSLDRARSEIHIFDAVEATGSSGSWVRITDSEYRMLNDLAKKLGGVKNQVSDKVTGTLKIVSENPYCTSCQGVIQQFSDMFPNIEITLIDGVK